MPINQNNHNKKTNTKNFVVIIILVIEFIAIFFFCIILETKYIAQLSLSEPLELFKIIASVLALHSLIIASMIFYLAWRIFQQHYGLLEIKEKEAKMKDNYQYIKVQSIDDLNIKPKKMNYDYEDEKKEINIPKNPQICSNSNSILFCIIIFILLIIISKISTIGN